MRPFKGANPDFDAIMDAPAGRAAVRAGGIDVPVRVWGPPDAPGIVLVHGVAAHARWWDPVGPPLADRETPRRVVALDLSGHGDAGRRDRYAIDTWADEVLAVVADDVSGRDPAVVGHSLGGMVTLVAAARAELSRAVVIDSMVRARDPELERRRHARAEAPERSFASPEEAVDRFRTYPPQECLPAVRDHVARTGIRRVGDGWRWKRDPRIFARPTLFLDDLRPPRCPVSIIRCTRGRLTEPILAGMLARIGPADVAVLDCGHHPMLDHPQELTTELARMT